MSIEEKLALQKESKKEGLIKGEKKMNNNFLKLMVILLAIYTYCIYFIEGVIK